MGFSPMLLKLSPQGGGSIMRRQPFAAREKAAILMMRKQGCRIQHIAMCTGRSTSVIHRILKRGMLFGHNLDVWRRTLDMRKIRAKQRLRSSISMLLRMLKLIEAWHNFILGEGDKPP